MMRHLGLIRWVVTGPIAAGKSLVSGEIARLTGAPVINGDELGHRVLGQGEVQRAISEKFGPQLVVDGEVDRRALGALVFADPAALEWLNRLTHGPISEMAEEAFQELEKSPERSLAVLEAAVYFLFPTPPRADLVIAVTAPAEARARRLAGDRGLTAQQARARIAAQAHLDPLWARAGRTIVNDGPRRQLLARVEQLVRTELAGNS